MVVHSICSRRAVMSAENQYKYVISYGKSRVPVYRVYATPLSGLTPVPESSFTGREIPFRAAQVPQGGQAHFGDSNVLFSRSHDDYATASMDFDYAGGTAKITGHHCSQVGMHLLKVTGSAFTHFARDAYTTLPERGDRPLYIYLDVHWKYTDPT